MASGSAIQIPSRLPLLLTHEGVLLPGSTMRSSVDSPRNMQLVRSRLLKGTSLKSTIIGVIPNTSDPASDCDELPSLHRIGTAALAVQVVGSNWPKPHYTLLITGLCRFQILQLLKEKPYPVAEVEQLDRLEQFTNQTKSEEELGELSEQFYKYAVQLVEMLDMSVPAVAKLRRLLDNLPREALPDVLTSIIRTSNQEKLQILDAVSLEERFKMTIPLLVRQIEGLKLLQKTRKRKQDDDKRVVAIRPIRRISHVPGTAEDEEEDEDHDDIVMLEKKIKTSSMPEQALKVCVKEIKRLKKMPQSMPEYALTRNYLELMVELPWNKSTKDRLDIRAARILLDNDHYAMEKLKKRVLEYLAVRQLKNNLKGPILCFVGPPGVGKTSVGRSVAKTLGREFHRIALGGVCDQSDIRGHRRTYVGSMPGRIINGLKTVGVNNPVFLLDEVDKLGKSLQGDPAAALLEVRYVIILFSLSHTPRIALQKRMSLWPLGRGGQRALCGFFLPPGTVPCSSHWQGTTANGSFRGRYLEAQQGQHTQSPMPPVPEGPQHFLEWHRAGDRAGKQGACPGPGAHCCHPGARSLPAPQFHALSPLPAPRTPAPCPEPPRTPCTPTPFHEPSHIPRTLLLPQSLALSPFLNIALPPVPQPPVPGLHSISPPRCGPRPRKFSHPVLKSRRFIKVTDLCD
uniref:Lon N-terminal domain-containing protein n=1 Tax=Gopherus agassizii TaxID=38772 RepID=A0A452GGF3_9SAUR